MVVSGRVELGWLLCSGGVEGCNLGEIKAEPTRVKNLMDVKNRQWRLIPLDA